MDLHRTEEEGWKAVRASSRTLKLLADGYDAGDFDVAREIATVVHRMLVDELPLTKRRRDLAFLSIAAPQDETYLLAHDLLNMDEVRVRYSAGVDEKPSFTVTFLPIFLEPQMAQRRVVKFADWWNGVAYIATSAPDGVYVPIDPLRRIPFDKRARLSRFQMVKAFRNKVGAHYDRTVDAEAKSLEDTLMRVGVGIEIKDVGSFSYFRTPELFEFKNSRPQASMRHIAQELIEASSGWS